MLGPQDPGDSNPALSIRGKRLSTAGIFAPNSFRVAQGTSRSLSGSGTPGPSHRFGYAKCHSEKDRDVAKVICMKDTADECARTPVINIDDKGGLGQLAQLTRRVAAPPWRKIAKRAFRSAF